MKKIILFSIFCFINLPTSSMYACMYACGCSCTAVREKNTIEDLHNAIESGDEKKVKKCLKLASMFHSIDTVNDTRLYKQKTIDYSSRLVVEHSPLFQAVASNALNVVKLLLERGANVNEGVETPFGLNSKRTISPLAEATRLQNVEIATLLLQYHANPNQGISSDDYSRTWISPIKIALENKNAPLIKLLRKYRVSYGDFWANNRIKELLEEHDDTQEKLAMSAFMKEQERPNIGLAATFAAMLNQEFKD